MNTEKLYTIELNVKDLIHVTSTLGQRYSGENLRDLKNHTEENLWNYAKELVPIANDMVDKGIAYISTYEKFKNKLREINEDFKPKTKTVYFCLYKNYNHILGTSGLFDTKQSMYTAIDQREIIEEFSREIPV